jgi:OmpA-OmpF porin, OOP family
MHLGSSLIPYPSSLIHHQDLDMKKRLSHLRPLLCAATTLASLSLLGGTAAAQSTQTAQASGSTLGARDDAYSLLPYTRRGYAGINLGRPDIALPCGSGGYDCSKPDVGVHIYTGGLFNDFFGMEVGYLNSGRAARAGGRTWAHGLNVSALLRAQSGAFNVFAKAGATYGQARVSVGPASDQPSGKGRGWGGSYGLGLGYDFRPDAGIVLEWSRHELRFPGTGRRDLDMTSVGYVHRF